MKPITPDFMIMMKNIMRNKINFRFAIFNLQNTINNMQN